ncbi:fucolectin-1-like [Watersipora subatra]|uniref:fucolectin-1-like n=1 Tax=Watersipora subatra TaxID=2589382 RepID=UPI00355BA02D
MVGLGIVNPKQAPRLARFPRHGKNVTLSSVRYSTQFQMAFSGSFAVDGIYHPPQDDARVSMAQTNKENNPWLRVDLQKMHCIWAVRILNRGDAQHQNTVERLRDVIITAANTEEELFYQVYPKSFCAEFKGILNQYFTTITCIQPMRAQFVQLQMFSNDFLHIYEFEVHGFSRE